jgi:hypothetical protein
MRTQVEISNAVHVTDRTIRTWLRDPIFIAFGDALRLQAGSDSERASVEAEVRFQGRRLEQISKAQDVVDKALEAGDEKVAMAVLRLMAPRNRQRVS